MLMMTPHPFEKFKNRSRFFLGMVSPSAAVCSPQWNNRKDGGMEEGVTYETFLEQIDLLEYIL